MYGAVREFSINVKIYINDHIKGTISDRPFQTSFFPNPEIFFFKFKEKLLCNNLPVQQLSRKQHIFWKERELFVVGN